MNTIHSFGFMIVLGLVLLSSCKSDSTSSNNTNNSNSTAGVSATVNGGAWAATTVQAVWKNNALGIGGVEVAGIASRQINISGVVTQPGTYQLGPTTGIIATFTDATAAGVKIFIVSSGSLVVEELSATGAKGTFQYEARESNGGSETRSITNGRFNVKF